jgi:hypothetical protein
MSAGMSKAEGPMAKVVDEPVPGLKMAFQEGHPIQQENDGRFFVELPRGSTTNLIFTNVGPVKRHVAARHVEPGLPGNQLRRELDENGGRTDMTIVTAGQGSITAGWEQGDQAVIVIRPL